MSGTMPDVGTGRFTGLWGPGRELAGVRAAYDRREGVVVEPEITSSEGGCGPHCHPKQCCYCASCHGGPLQPPR